MSLEVSGLQYHWKLKEWQQIREGKWVRCVNYATPRPSIWSDAIPKDWKKLEEEAKKRVPHVKVSKVDFAEPNFQGATPKSWEEFQEQIRQAALRGWPK